jgi:hypothetical protein
MSNPIKIALVCEGTTDRIVIEAAISSLVGLSEFVLTQLQPEGSLTFGPTGTGWGGVYHWCRLAVEQGGGSVRQNSSLDRFDILILHLDGDVANNTYESASIQTVIMDLPFVRPCPPPSTTTDHLREVVLRWLGEAATPPKFVLCIPSKNTEAWLLGILYPTDAIVLSGNLECYATPEIVLSTKPADHRLVRMKNGRARKQVGSYRSRVDEIKSSWPSLRNLCTEADRFSNEFSAMIPVAE